MRSRGMPRLLSSQEYHSKSTASSEPLSEPSRRAFSRKQNLH